MEETYNVASKRSSKKEQDVKRHQRKILSHTILQPGDKALVHNLPGMGRTGKMRSYCEPEIHRAIENNKYLLVVYKI